MKWPSPSIRIPDNTILVDTAKRPFQRAVALELHAARQKHALIHSLHEASAVIREEYEEFWNYVKMNAEYRCKESLLQELVQIAAAAQRTAEDLGLIDAVGTFPTVPEEHSCHCEQCKKLRGEIT